MVIEKGKELGVHTILEFYGCPPENLQKSEEVEKIFRTASEISNAHIVDSLFHHFNPYGVSGVVVIAESHFTVHTWPEHGYAAIDFFSCSEDVDLNKAISFLKEKLKPAYVSRMDIKRGILDE